MEPTYEAVLADPARAFLLSQTSVARERIGRLICIIELDPFIDGRIKFALKVGGEMFTVYDHPEYWIQYHMVDNAKILIDLITPSRLDRDYRPPTLPPNLKL